MKQEWIVETIRKQNNTKKSSTRTDLEANLEDARIYW